MEDRRGCPAAAPAEDSTRDALPPVSRARLVRIDPTAPDPSVIGEAADILRTGGLVAFPTETVYGLGAHALDDHAVRRIFEAKGRPSYNPLIVHVPDVAAAQLLTASWPGLAERAAAAFWPGPLTLVLPKVTAVPDSVTAGLPTVAVRVPSHPVALALLRRAAVPVAAPSANRFTRVSPTTAAHVARGLGDHVDLILDGGATPFGMESTVLDVTGSEPVLLRHGAISRDELEAALGRTTTRVTTPPPLAASPAADPSTVARPAPGMLDRHYSPAADLVVFSTAAQAAAAISSIRTRMHEARVGALLINPLAGVAVDEVVPLPGDAAGYARLFYAALHTLDELGCRLILVEQVPAGAAWDTLRDRLRRASAGRPA
jgi:L-threonylcarbamoyladenylate synthase